jgi:hypothetical protein
LFDRAQRVGNRALEHIVNQKPVYSNGLSRYFQHDHRRPAVDTWTVVKLVAILVGFYGAYDSFKRWRVSGSGWNLYNALFLSIAGTIWAIAIIFRL